MYKVLVIAYYFPPMGLSGVQRTLKFVKYMKNYNWEPTVLTSNTTGYYAHDLFLLKEAEKANIKIVRVSGKGINAKLASKGTVKIPPEFIRKFLSRLSSTFFIPDNKRGWANEAFPVAEKLLQEEKFDLIFVSAPPFSSVNMAVKLNKKFNIPLIIDYRDLWYGNQFGFYPTPYHRYLHKKMEYKALKTADKIIATNRKMKEKIIEKYQFLTFEDIYIIPHGYDPEDFKDLKIEKKSNSKMRLTYSGIFYEFVTPKYFLHAFKELSIERPDVTANIELHFVGYLRNENKKLVKKLEMQEVVKEYGYLNHNEALTKLMSSDVLWMMVGNGRNADTISSGKLYEYFGTRKPLLVSVPDGALKTAATEYKAAYITKPDDVTEIKNNILKIYEDYVKNSLPVPDEEFIIKHRRDFLTELLTKQFQFSVKEGVL
ncbi:MAG TPA: glycosyltransferase family 4 protein [Ignavibacteriaceae bacterium]|nr:glycosyltransferase family 4 protein [Ignavibacteriaceae bacterium]